MNDLVKAAQRGEPEAQATLWAQVKQLAFKIANQYRRAAALRGGADCDDLAQCAALGVLEALRSYAPDKGSFTTWLGFYVRKACRECLGMTGRDRREHYNTVSLDAPIGGDTEDLIFGDTLPDESASLAFEQTEDALDNQLLHNALDAALDRLPEGMKQTIRLHDLDGLTLQETADRQGVHRNTAQQWRRTGFNRLRRHPSLRAWYTPDYHRHKGLAAFRTTWSSVVEDEVIRKLDGRT